MKHNSKRHSKPRNWHSVNAKQRKAGAHKLDSEKRKGNRECWLCGDEIEPGDLCEDCQRIDRRKLGGMKSGKNGGNNEAD